MELPEIPLNRDLTYLGITTYRDKNQLFGIKRKDRRQHVYILGKSGTGKSALMFNMIIQNIQNGEGVCMVDPHGENVEAILSAIPPHRMKDVIYFNPADADHHIGFNVLELEDPQYKHLVASGLMGIFTKIWANAWSARMEYILNNTILALLDTPGSTMLGIPRMLVDKDYRQKIIGNLKDPVIKAFWVHEYEAWQDKFQNKVGQFLSTAIIRNVVGQSKSTINIFNMMNEGKIFLVNVSKGRIGEDNSALLGGMIITKIQLAAMERVRIPEESRKDFYLYVDEFQNFVTDAFAGILSEARKYRLNLTVAHQYTAQLIVDKSSMVRDAVFGNVGTMIIFRVGSEDAKFLEREFEPEFTPQDIVNLPNYKVYLKLMIDGVTSRPFSAKTLPPMAKSGNKEIEEKVINSSRDLYCKKKEDVEREINAWSGMSLGDDTQNTFVNTGEKFNIICSSCGENKTVPFKPEEGRKVYCKECMAKIKSGEIKLEKEDQNKVKKQIKTNEAEFYKPLADIGIEFKSEESSIANTAPIPIPKKENTPLKEALNMALTQKDVVKKEEVKPKILEVKKEEVKIPETKQENVILPQAQNLQQIKEVQTPTPVSLDSLKDKLKESVSITKDKSASPEKMNELKDFISTVTKPKVEDVEVQKPEMKVEVQEEIKKEIQQENKIPKPPEPPTFSIPKPPEPTPSTPNIPMPDTILKVPVKEVPEDVLRKILE